MSRSGRIRKKSSKLADFESPDEIDNISQTKKTSKTVRFAFLLPNYLDKQKWSTKNDIDRKEQNISYRHYFVIEC